MEKKEFKILIDAPNSKVWNILWGEDTYPAWTAAFMPGSRVEPHETSVGDLWGKGNKVRFLGPDNEGMISEIAENKSNEYMSFRHLGVVKKGREDYDSPGSKDWAGSLENYSLRSINGRTELKVDMDITPEYLDYFSNAWPKALEKVKELAEK